MDDGEKSRQELDATLFVQSSLPGAALPLSDPLPGTQLQHFEVTRLLGRGGMGAVYYGKDLSLERPVAIKVLSPEIAHDPEIVARFAREARSQARLRHPNVAQIYFIGQDRGFHFFVMEYLEGPGLDMLLSRPEPLPWIEAVEYTLAAARGLRAALNHGFVHRDVKPSNLILDQESKLKILDFGLVKNMHGDAQLTRDGAIVGSPLYMSPEQGRGGVADHRSDIYSLGCTLFQMLVGKPPFQSPSPVGIISMHVTDRPQKVNVLNPEVPEVVANIVDRMLAKAPSDRYNNYDELIAALEAASIRRREMGGLRARGIALAIDGVTLLILAYLLGIFALPLLCAYFVVFHRLMGQTPGKWLLGIRVETDLGGQLSWKTSILRFLVFAWGPLAWTILAMIVYSIHGRQPLSFRLADLSLSELTVPITYTMLSTLILVAYLAGFLLVAFHPKRLALHDILAHTLVFFKNRAPAGEVVEAVRSTTWFGRSRTK
jgi:uncharacterized RDD family membrane protein YckC/predicted Ser/Thr protein kinase